MLTVLKNTFVTFAKNGEVILLLVILMTAPVFVDMPHFLLLLLNFAFMIGAQLILFIYLLRPNAFYKLKSPAFILKFTLFYLGITIVYTVATELATWLTFKTYMYIKIDLMFKNIWFFYLFSLIPSLVVAGYFAMRLFVIIPMIIMDDKLSLKNIYNMSKGSNALWLIAPIIFVFPAISLYLILGEGEIFTILFCLITLLLCCFYSCYYQSKNVMILQTKDNGC